MAQIITNYLKIRFSWAILLGSLCLFLGQQAQAQVPQEEFEALRDFYFSTGGSSWNNKEGWETFESDSAINNVNNNWRGIMVENGRVTSVELNDNNLGGSIPESIGSLSELVTLNLSGTTSRRHNITNLPESVGNLNQLETLDLRWNNLSSLPESIGNLSQLKTLDLNGSNLSSLPESIGNLNQLETLSLSGINSLPESIGKLSKLNELHIEEVIIDTLPESISDLTNLEVLNLRRTYVHVLPENIGNLKRLKSLDLSGYAQRIGLNDLPASFADLDSLTFLSLGGKPLKRFPKEICDLASLKTLGANWCMLDSIPSCIGNLSQLVTLDLGSNNLSSLPESIGNLSQLITLDLHQNNLSSLPESIGNLSQLVILNLDGNNLSSLPESIGNLQNLSYLNLINNNLSSLPESIGNLSNLVRLDLSSNNLSSLPESIGNLQNLSELSLNDNNLTTLPESLGRLNISFLRLENNRLDFGNLMPYIDVIQGNASQNKILASPNKLFLVENDSSQIYRDFGHEGDQYTWFKINGEDTSSFGNSDNFYEMSNANPLDTGRYYCNITNETFPNLTLEIEPSQVDFVPASPTNLSALASQFRKEIQITWQDNSIYESRYIIQRRVLPDSTNRLPQDTLFASIITLDKNDTSYVDTVPKMGTQYEYRVLMLAQDSSIFYTDTLLYSNLVERVFVPPVQNVEIGNINCKNIQIIWEDHSSEESTLILERKSEHEDDFTVIAELAPNTTHFTDPNIQIYTEYAYRVRAIGPNLADTAFVTQPLLAEVNLIAPDKLRARSTNNGTSAILTWLNILQDCKVDLFVEKAIGTPEQFVVIDTLSDQDNSYLDEDVEMKVQYFYRIKLGTTPPVYSHIRSLMILPNAEERKDSTNQDSFEFALENIDRFVKIYPNPSSEVLHIQMKHPKQGEVEMELYNPQGHLVQEVSYFKPKGFQTFRWHIQAGDLPQGMYRLVIHWQGKKLVKPLLISK